MSGCSQRELEICKASFSDKYSLIRIVMISVFFCAHKTPHFTNKKSVPEKSKTPVIIIHKMS